MKTVTFGDGEAFHGLEEKIINNNARLEDMVSFQKLIDECVHRIVALSPEELFVIEPTRCAQQESQESMILYTICEICGQQVLASRSIERQNKILCLPCFQKETPGLYPPRYAVTAAASTTIHWLRKITVTPWRSPSKA